MAEYIPHKIPIQDSPAEFVEKLLYVDILNFITFFFKTGKWDIQKASKIVKKFISVAKNAGWKLKIFIGGVPKSKKSVAEWMKRREKEALECRKNVPQSCSTLIGDLFSAEGVEVVYSSEKDNHETMAYHAVADDADILSADKNFFRYKSANYRVFKNFYFSSGMLGLEEYPVSERQAHGDITYSLDPPPPVLTYNPVFTCSTGPYTYRRGVPSPLVRMLGNPHIDARPLRRALYARLGIEAEVLEIFPVWDNNRQKITWDTERVIPNSKWDFLLDLPRAALIQVYSCPNWPPPKPYNVLSSAFNKHVFAMEIIVFEICKRAKENTIRLADMMLSLSSQFCIKP